MTKPTTSKPQVVTADTPPDELPPELRGTIFDSSHVERGSHLQADKVDEVFNTPPRRSPKEDTMATKATDTKPATKAAAKPAAKPANKVAAKPSTPFDRVKASSAWAKESPCQAATGPKRDPRACKGVGVVDRETEGGQTIKVCAAHVLAASVATVAERQQAIKDKEALKADKVKPAPKAAAAKGNGATKAKAPAPKPATKAKTKPVDLTARA
jgi:hypothetical protein